MGLSDLFFPKKTLITVDMGSKYIKAARFTIVDRRPVLTHCEMAAMPAQVMDKSTLLDHQPVHPILKDLLYQQMQYQNQCKVVLGIGGSAVVTRKLSVIRTDHDSVKKENIRFEASQHLPFDIEQAEYVTIDLPCMEDDDPHMDSVFLIAIQNKDFSAYNLCIYEASVRTDVIFPSVLSLQYVVSENYKNLDPSEYVLILDIGFQTTGFYILRNSHVLFSRDLFTGAQSYVQEIQRRLGVNNDEAQNLLDTACKGESIPDEVMGVIQNYNSTAAQDISLGMEYFLNYFPKAVVSKILATGGAYNIPGLQSEISQKMNLSLQNLQIFRGIQTKGFSKKKLADLNSFASVCVGLALGQTAVKL